MPPVDERRDAHANGVEATVAELQALKPQCATALGDSGA